MKKNIAIFASGSGTNAENIIRYFIDNEHYSVSLVVSNKQDAGVLMRAKELRVPSVVMPKDVWMLGDKVQSLLHSYHIDFIV